MREPDRPPPFPHPALTLNNRSAFASRASRIVPYIW